MTLQYASHERRVGLERLGAYWEVHCAMVWLAATILGLAAAVAALVHYSIVFPRVAGPAITSDAPAGMSESAARLTTHLRAVASRPHNLDYPADLEAAATYIETTLRGFGYAPVRQTYSVRGQSVRNIEVVIEPIAARAASTLVIGAHYDSPDDSPGANDNGTGVAAALELARTLSGFRPKTQRLRLAFWVNEEAPYGHTPDMGSWQHANLLKMSGERIDGMIALETIGYFSDQPGSQKFPPPFDLVYPDRGNFIAFVGLPGSRRFLRASLAAFRRTAAIPSIGGVAPGFIHGIDLSDHWAFHQFGFPAIMITDTAPFRNPYYHQRDDLPETVDTLNLARVTQGIIAMVKELTG